MTEKNDAPSTATMMVEEGAKKAGVSRTAMYQACARGEIPCTKIGRRVLILTKPFNKMLGETEPVA